MPAARAHLTCTEIIAPFGSVGPSASVRYGFAHRGLCRLCLPRTHRVLRSLHPALPALTPYSTGGGRYRFPLTIPNPPKRPLRGGDGGFSSSPMLIKRHILQPFRLCFAACFPFLLPPSDEGGGAPLGVPEGEMPLNENLYFSTRPVVIQSRITLVTGGRRLKTLKNQERLKGR